MAMYYNGKKVRNLYYNGKCITRLALGKEMTRLVEGDDFVRAEWLVATIPVGVLMMSLPLNTNDFYFKRKWHIFGNVGYFSTDTHAYFTHYSNRKVAVYDKSTGDSVVYGNSIDADIEIVINSNIARTIINNIDVPMYGDTATSISFQNAANGQNTAEFSTSAITVDGIERYIPVRLLRPIPAALDANGIARNAGECGMFDSISGKFYGNVGSGAFTVSDN